MSGEIDEEVVARVRKLVEENTRCSAMMKTSECEKFQRQLWNAIKDTQGSHWDSLIASANRDDGDALMHIYMSDGWGCWMNDNVSFQTMDQTTSNREFRYKAEWLLEKSILKRLSTLGIYQMAMRSHKPRLMVQKSAWHIFQASLLAEPILRLQRPKGIIMSVYLQYGLHFRNFKATQAARHNLFYDENILGLEDILNWVARQMDWEFTWWCVLHILSLALKWGLYSISTRPDLKDDVHIVIASLRNGSGALMDAVSAFVLGRVRYRESNEGHDTRATCFLLAGCPLEFIEDCKAVDPWYDFSTGLLWVDGALELDPGRHAKIESVILYTMQWDTFADTRWGGLGRSCRCWSFSQITGVDGIADMVVHDSSAMQDGIAGYPRFSKPDVRRYMIVASIGCYPIRTVTLP